MPRYREVESCCFRDLFSWSKKNSRNGDSKFNLDNFGLLARESTDYLQIAGRYEFQKEAESLVVNDRLLPTTSYWTSVAEQGALFRFIYHLCVKKFQLSQKILMVGKNRIRLKGFT